MFVRFRAQSFAPLQLAQTAKYNKHNQPRIRKYSRLNATIKPKKHDQLSVGAQNFAPEDYMDVLAHSLNVIYT